MQISAKVNVLKSSSSTLKAFATICIDDLIEVSGLKVIEGSRGLFVGMPSKAGKPDANGEIKYYDDIRFTDVDESGHSETKARVEEVVLAAYNAQVAKNTRANTASTRTDDPAPTGVRPAIARHSW